MRMVVEYHLPNGHAGLSRMLWRPWLRWRWITAGGWGIVFGVFLSVLVRVYCWLPGVADSEIEAYTMSDVGVASTRVIIQLTRVGLAHGLLLMGWVRCWLCWKNHGWYFVDDSVLLVFAWYNSNGGWVARGRGCMMTIWCIGRHHIYIQLKFLKVD